MNTALRASDSNVDFSVILSVSALEFRLDGSYNSKGFHVLYPANKEKPIDLGSVSDGLKALGNTLLGNNGGTKLLNEIKNFIKELPTIFQEVIDGFLSAHILINRIEIRTGEAADNKVYYALGLTLLFTKAISIAGISLEYFTFDFESTSGSKAVKSALAASPQA